MSAIQKLLTDHIDIWTAAETEKKSGRGRSSGNAGNVYGIKKLRELILELAVRGKLVPQDANDEPASELLKRIQTEKAKLVAEGKIKKSPLTPLLQSGESTGTAANLNSNTPPLVQGGAGGISVEEQPFELPVGWEWVRLPEIYYPISVSGNKLLSSEIKETGRFPVVDQGQRYIAGYTDNDELLISLPGPVVVFGDHTTERKLVDFNFVAGADGVKILRPLIQDDKFFLWQLVSLKLEGRGYARHYKVLNESFYALPPLAEQHRIVAKVDELMALCDQLETQHSNAADAHEKLVNHLLGTLTQSNVRGEPVVPRPSTSSGRTEFEDNWQRIATHFDTLFTTEASIDALKQTLLQLAVMGKLVPQDPNDEPASELLKRIQAEKAKLVAEGKIKKAKSLPPINDEEKPFDLPKEWKWVRFGEICSIKAELVRPEDFADLRQVAPDCIEKGTGQLTEVRTVRESGVRGPNSRFYKGQIVYSKIRPSLSKAVLVDFDGLCSADMYPINTFIDSSFLLRQILSEFFLEQVRIAENRIKMPKLNQESLTAFVLPVPPIAEQHRIVAKVDELMTICDQLKSRLTKASQLQQKLTDVLVEQAVSQ